MPEPSCGRYPAQSGSQAVVDPCRTVRNNPKLKNHNAACAVPGKAWLPATVLSVRTGQCMTLCKTWSARVTKDPSR